MVESINVPNRVVGRETASRKTGKIGELNQTVSQDKGSTSNEKKNIRFAVEILQNVLN